MADNKPPLSRSTSQRDVVNSSGGSPRRGSGLDLPKGGSVIRRAISMLPGVSSGRQQEEASSASSSSSSVTESSSAAPAAAAAASPPTSAREKKKEKKKSKKTNKKDKKTSTTAPAAATVTPPPPPIHAVVLMQPRFIPEQLAHIYKGHTQLFVNSLTTEPPGCPVVKLVVCGESGVGKTAMLMRIKHRRFEADTKSTVGVDFFLLGAQMQETYFKLQMWDTAGQERFAPIADAYYRGSHIVMVMYDITRKQTFSNVQNYITKAQSYAENPMIVIIGNKCDREDIREVTFQVAAEFAKKFNFCLFETSALNGIHVEDAFVTVTEIAFKEFMVHKRNRVDDTAASKKVIVLTDARDVKESQANNSSSSCSC